MRSQDSILWLGVAAVLLYLYSRRDAGVPSLPWTLNRHALGFDPYYIPPPETRIAIANQTVQKPFQGGTLSPSNTQATVDAAAAGYPIFY